MFRTIRDTVKLATETVTARAASGRVPEPAARQRDKINPQTGTVDPELIETDDVLIARYNCSTTRKSAAGETEQLGGTATAPLSTGPARRPPWTRSSSPSPPRARTWSGSGPGRCGPRGRRQVLLAVRPEGAIGADEVDMPFSPRSGCTPDLIINAHGQPSRMTIGHILETLCGKAAALRGEQVDGTPFVASADAGDSPDGVVDKYGAQLEAFGFQADGCETLYDGRTGKPLEMQVFVGPVAYSKLRHMVVDKYHARSRGPRSFQTRQPLDGRGRDGGQRVGEMERDCCIAHGASFVLEERLLTSSDQVDVYVCAECGHFAHQPQTTNGNPAHCVRCLSSDSANYPARLQAIGAGKRRATHGPAHRGGIVQDQCRICFGLSYDAGGGRNDGNQHASTGVGCASCRRAIPSQASWV